ncbi:hypothetical protein LPB137_10465 [Poseidonibacter parvus]|uniref:Cadherin-like domain-containing protein n=1 Tax=Poseidonibacter parvus TaxID=1850254 RepID=A0A1P8KNW8_9BACT|nr:VCBS domain-containing protein [Poseidonibacter parvus]APW66238.1 hypothetical protein LPB137_10465 [Poseidonibacter parvus]
MVSIEKYGQEIDLSKIVSLNGKKSLTLENLVLNNTVQIKIPAGIKYISSLEENDLKIVFTDIEGNILELILKDMAELLAQNNGFTLVELIEILPDGKENALASITDLASALQESAAGPGQETNANSDSGATPAQEDDNLADQNNTQNAVIDNETLPRGVVAAAPAGNNIIIQNSAPIIELISAQTTDEDNSITIAYNSSDLDNDTLIPTVSATNGTVIIDANGDIVFTPNQDFNGNAVVTLEVSDGRTSTIQSFNVTVNSINDTPIISDYTEVTNVAEDILTGTISLTDVIAADVDINDTLSFVALTNVSTTVTDINSVGIGTVTVSMTNVGAYTLSGAGIDKLGAGDSATVTFDVQVIDDSGEANATSIAKKITLTIDGTNDAPEITAESSLLTLNEIDFSDNSTNNSYYQLIKLQTVLDTLDITDVDDEIVGMSLTTDSSTFAQDGIDITSTNTNGVFQVTTTNIGSMPVGAEVGDLIIYSEEIDALNTTDSIDATFKVRAYDGIAYSEEQTVNVTIDGTNDAPEITAESSLLTLNEIDFSDNSTNNSYYQLIKLQTVLDTLDITDVDDEIVGMSLTTDSSTFAQDGIDITSTNTNGVFQVTTTNIGSMPVGAEVGDLIIYSEEIDALNTTDSIDATFKVRAYDGIAYSEEQTVNVTIDGTNDAPEITAESSLLTLNEIDFSDNSTNNSYYQLIKLQTVLDTLDITDVDDEIVGMSLTTDSSTFAQDGIDITSTNTNGVFQVTTTNIGSMPVGAEVGDLIIYSEEIDALNTTDSIDATFKVRAYDGIAYSEEQIVNVTIDGTNDAPEITAESSLLTLNEIDFSDNSTNNSYYQLIKLQTVLDTLDITDVDDEIVGMSLTTDSSTFAQDGIDITSTNTNGVFQVTTTNIGSMPVGAEVGDLIIYSEEIDALNTTDSIDATFKVRAYDGIAYSEEQIVNVTIDGTNDAPEITAESSLLTLNEIDFSDNSTNNSYYQLIKLQTVLDTLDITDVDDEIVGMSLTTDSSTFAQDGIDITSTNTNGVFQVTTTNIGSMPSGAEVGDLIIYSEEIDALNTTDSIDATFKVRAYDGIAYSEEQIVNVTIGGVTDTLSGTSIDGYITGMTVLSDLDGDKTISGTETHTLTDEIGNFTLVGGDLSGTVIGYGGTDISTGLAFEGIYKAPEGSTVLNPITSLLVDLMNEGKTLTEAKTLIYNNLNIDSSVDLQADPIATAISSEDSTIVNNNVSFQTLNVTINNTIGQLAVALDGTNERDASDIISQEIAKMIILGNLDFTSSSSIDTLITNALTTSNTTISDSIKTDILTIIVNTNTAIINSTTDTINVVEAFENLAKKQIAAEETENELEAGILSGNTTTAVSNSTGEVFQMRVNEATVGSVTQAQESQTAPIIENVTNLVNENDLIDNALVEDFTYAGLLTGTDIQSDTINFEYLGNLIIKLTTTQSAIVAAVNADTAESLAFLKAEFTQAISNPLIATVISEYATLQNVAAGILAAPSVSTLVTYLNSFEEVTVDVTTGEITVEGEVPQSYVNKLEEENLLFIDVQTDGNYTISSPLFNSMDDNQSAELKFDYIANDGVNESNIKTVSLTVTGANDAPIIEDVTNVVNENDLNDSLLVPNYNYSGLLTGIDADLNDTVNFEYVGNLIIKLTTTQSAIVAAVNADTAESLAFLKAEFTQAISNPLIATVISEYATLQNVAAGILAAPSVSTLVTYLNSFEEVTVDVTTGEITVEGEVPQSYVNKLEEENLLFIDVQTDGNYTISSPLFNSMDDNQSAELKFDYIANDGVNESNIKTVSLTVTGANDAPIIEDVTNVVNENDLNDSLLVPNYNYSGLLTGIDADLNDTVNFEYVGNLIIKLTTTQSAIVAAVNADTAESLAFLKAEFTQAISNPLIATVISEYATLQNVAAGILAAPSVSTLVTYLNSFEEVTVDVTTGEITVEGEVPQSYVNKLEEENLLFIDVQTDGNYTISSPLFNSMDDNQSAELKFDYIANDGVNESSIKTISLLIDGETGLESTSTPSFTSFSLLSSLLENSNVINENDLIDNPITDYVYQGILTVPSGQDEIPNFEYLGNLIIKLTTTQSAIVAAVNADTAESLAFLKAEFTQAISNPLIATVISEYATLQNVAAGILAAPSVSTLVTYLNSFEEVTVDVATGEITVEGEVTQSYVDKLEEENLLFIDVQTDGNYTISSPLFNSMQEDQSIKFTFDYSTNSSETNIETVNVTIDGTNDAPEITAESSLLTLNEIDFSDNSTNNSYYQLIKLQTVLDTLDITDVDDEIVGISLTTDSSTFTQDGIDITSTNTNGVFQVTTTNIGSMPSGAEVGDLIIYSEEIDALNTTDSIDATFKVRAYDGIAYSEEQTVNVTIDGTNDAPEITAESSLLTLNEIDFSDNSTNNSYYQLIKLQTVLDTLDITDVDDEIVGMSLTTDSSTFAQDGIDITSTNTNGVFQVTTTNIGSMPSGAEVGDLIIYSEEIDALNTTDSIDATFKVRAYDGIAYSEEQIVNVTIDGTNDAPEITAESSLLTLNEIDFSDNSTNNSYYQLIKLQTVLDTLDITDVDDEIVGMSLTTDSSTFAQDGIDITSTNTNGVFQVTTTNIGSMPSGAEVGDLIIYSEEIDALNTTDSIDATFKVRAYDGIAYSEEQIVNVTIDGTNDAPEITAESSLLTLNEIDFSDNSTNNSYYQLIKLQTVLDTLDITDVDDEIVGMSLTTDSSTFAQDGIDITSTNTNGVFQVTTTNIGSMPSGAEVGDLIIYSEEIDALNTTDSIDATFKVRAYDGIAYSEEQTVNVTIGGVTDEVIINPSFAYSTEVNGEITSYREINGNSIDYINFTHNGGRILFNILTEESDYDDEINLEDEVVLEDEVTSYIDINGNNVQEPIDSYIYLYNNTGVFNSESLIDSNDDSFSDISREDGSTSSLDSLLSIDNLASGDYTLVVGTYPLSEEDIINGFNENDTDSGPYKLTISSDTMITNIEKTVATPIDSGNNNDNSLYIDSELSEFTMDGSRTFTLDSNINETNYIRTINIFVDGATADSTLEFAGNVIEAKAATQPDNVNITYDGVVLTSGDEDNSFIAPTLTSTQTLYDFGFEEGEMYVEKLDFDNGTLVDTQYEADEEPAIENIILTDSDNNGTLEAQGTWGKDELIFGEARQVTNINGIDVSLYGLYQVDVTFKTLEVPTIDNIDDWWTERFESNNLIDFESKLLNPEDFTSIYTENNAYKLNSNGTIYNTFSLSITDGGWRTEIINGQDYLIVEITNEGTIVYKEENEQIYKTEIEVPGVSQEQGVWYYGDSISVESIQTLLAEVENNENYEYPVYLDDAPADYYFTIDSNDIDSNNIVESFNNEITITNLESEVNVITKVESYNEGREDFTTVIGDNTEVLSEEDDIIVLNDDSPTRYIDANDGEDTLDLSGEGSSLDLASLLENVSVYNIENIDTGANDAAHILSNFTLDEFISLTDEDNTLKIFGDDVDSIELDPSQNWSQAMMNDGVPYQEDGFNVYYSSKDDQSLKLLIEDTITVEVP